MTLNENRNLPFKFPVKQASIWAVNFIFQPD